MLFSLAIIVTFVLISVYFYLRSEKLERDIIKQKQGTVLANKEHIVLADSLVVIGKKNAEFAKHRLKILAIKVETLEQYSRKAQDKRITTISPLINSYNQIFQDAAKTKGRVKVITKECYDNVSPTAYQEFSAFIKRSEKQIIRSWSSNNLAGFITLVESLLLDYEKAVEELILAQKTNVENQSVTNIKNKKSA